jgi:hypothetical protein
MIYEITFFATDFVLVRYLFSRLRSSVKDKHDAPTVPYFLPFGLDTLWEGIQVSPPSKTLILAQ